MTVVWKMLIEIDINNFYISDENDEFNELNISYL